MFEKRPKKAPKSPRNCAMCTSTSKPRTRRILGYVAQIRISRAPSPPATPHFLWFPSLRIPTRHVDRGTSGHLVQPEGRPAHAQCGQTVGPLGSPGRKKSFFPKLFLDHLGCSNTSFWAILEPVVARFGPWKIPKCLENGLFGTKNGSKMGQKRVFPKMILDHL